MRYIMRSIMRYIMRYIMQWIVPEDKKSDVELSEMLHNVAVIPSLLPSSATILNDGDIPASVGC